MTIDPAQVDAALTTTRSVRRRLDLERDVDNQILLDCIDIAEQAPTGGNQGSRRWIIIRDAEMKKALGDLYRQGAGTWMNSAAERLRGTGHPQERVMASAAYLAEHLSEVPAIVIPTILGVHDGSGRPGLFDSVIQAAWSFCIALRARGLGTAWVTGIFEDMPKVKELLGIPGDVTEIVMFPVAWTKGTDFRRAERHPARSITYFDHYGSTFESGPHETLRFEDGVGLVVEADIHARPSVVWRLVTDINLPARFSWELQSAEWQSDGPALGATFLGRNNHWAVDDTQVPCFVDAYEENRAFGWRTSDPEAPGARWRFDLEHLQSGIDTRLRFSVTIGPGFSGVSAAIARTPDLEARILRRRVREFRENMQSTVEGIKQLAEADPADQG